MTTAGFKGPPPIELRQLYAFRVVAEELHFGRAAARLGISQPPLSQQIQRLEAQLGCRLFDRDTRRVELTPSGVALRDLAEAQLGQLAAGLERVREIATGEAGRLIVGFTPTTALAILPRVVRAFRRRHANVGVELYELLPDAMLDALRTGHIDVALMRDPAAAAGIDAVPLFTERYVAILPTGHPLAGTDGPVDIAHMAGDPFVLFPRDGASQGVARILGICAAAGFTPHVVQEVPGWQTAISMVGSGLGVSILPESVSSLHLSGIVYRHLAIDARSSVEMLRRTDNDRPMVANFFASSVGVMAE